LAGRIITNSSNTTCNTAFSGLQSTFLNCRFLFTIFRCLLTTAIDTPVISLTLQQQPFFTQNNNYETDSSRPGNCCNDFALLLGTTAHVRT